MKRSLKAATDTRTQTEEQIGRKEQELSGLQTTISEARQEASKLEQMTIDLKANISVTKVVTEINHAKIAKVLRRSTNIATPDAPQGSSEGLKAQQARRQKLASMVQYFRDRFADVEVFHPQLWASFYENQ